jgi:hypothetical protein
MTDEFRCQFMDSIMDDVYALIAAAEEAGDEDAKLALCEEFAEWINPYTSSRDVVWMPQLIS